MIHANNKNIMKEPNVINNGLNLEDSLLVFGLSSSLSLYISKIFKNSTIKNNNVVFRKLNLHIIPYI